MRLTVLLATLPAALAALTAAPEVEVSSAAEMQATRGGIAAELADALSGAGVAFAPGTAELTRDSRELLQTAAAMFLVLPPGTLIEIGVHTDAVGDREDNLILSRARAEAVRGLLVEYGAPADRLRAVGYGESAPRVSNATAGGRGQNRRVEFAVVQP